MKKKQLDGRIFKKEGEELQKFFHFRKRGFAVESKKVYNRNKSKRDALSTQY